MRPRGGMEPGEQTTGTRDEHYDLVSVLYHALHGAETIEAYVLDAEAEGNEQLAEFFREAQATHRQLAERAKGLLGIGGGVAPEAAGGATPGTAPLEGGVPPDTGPVDVRGRAVPEVGLPPQGGTTPGPVAGDVPPRSADIQREPNIPVDEVGVTAEEVPPMPDVPRTPSSTTPRPDEDLIAETRGVTPEDVQMGTSPERTPREAPPAGLAEDAETSGEPGRATQEQRAARQTEQEEEKGLIDRIKDALTDREESDRQRDR